MKSAASRVAWLLAVLVMPEVAGADSRPTTGPAVELPPMMVEESVSNAPWFYVNAGGTEFLSRCSASTTRRFVQGWLTKMQLVRVLVPDEFLMKMDVPELFVLYAQDLQHTVSAEIQRELQAAPGGDTRGGDRVNIAPNMRLSDRDMHASIVYIDESQFDAATMSVAPGHVRFLLRGRLPELPAWLVEGIERAWRGADFVVEPITLRPMVWRNQDESDALASDASRPRALLPANELFATEATRVAEKHHPRRMEARAAQQELFFRWTIDQGRKRRAALWKLAVQAAEGPVSEPMFEACFGFGFAELRDRLSDYLPQAVRKSISVDPGISHVARFEVERATPNEVARLRGEWERLAIAHVQRRLPQVSEPYIAQARRTLRRAYDAGDRDPRLLATMGLCEIDAGNPAGARQFIEPAVASGVARPRAYHELARLRFDELRRDVPDTKIFSFTELAPVIEPLRRVMPQAPFLPEVFVLLAEAWARCELSPNTAEFEELAMGARLFAGRPTVGLPIAAALARHGRKSEAAAILDASSAHAMDEHTRARVTRLRAELTATPGPTRADDAAKAADP